MADTDYQPCARCGTLTHIDQLDAKPAPGPMPDPTSDGRDWERLECATCYGPGFVASGKDGSAAS